MLAAAAQAVPKGALRDEIEDLLGLDVSTAARALDDLLRDPPSVVSAALAAWGFAGAEWVHSLPDAVETGPVPTQPQADAWACERTLGLIEHFPGDTRALDMVLASALATRVSWITEYELTDAGALRSLWSTRVTHVLESECVQDGDYLADTEQAGIVGVHTTSGMHTAPPGVEHDYDDEAELWVTSVIAHAGVDPADVLASAHDIAIAEVTGGKVPRKSLFDMPLGDGAFWTIAEEPALGGGEHARAILPAWRAASDHDLMAEPGLGFGIVRRALLAASGGSSGGLIDALQTAVGGYGQFGFEAAALGGIMIGGEWRKPLPARVATLRFAHPYAVVAVARGDIRREHPWHGMPVFAAWVAEPSEPSDVTAGTEI
jgi:hypothetical protein